MDPKGDDSGSDTLDQSLQKKCVVADDDSSSKQPDEAVSVDNAAEEPTTEPGGIMSDPKDSPASPSPPPPSQQQSSTDNNTSDTVLIVVKDKDLLPDENTCSSGKDDSRGFESKVRQISDDLKDTTLADENSLEKADDERDDNTEKQPSDADAATGVTLGDVKNESDGYDSDRTITYESSSKKSSSSSCEKEKSKKVRFKFNRGILCSDDEGDDEADGDEDEDEYEDDEVEEEEDTLNEGGKSKKIRIPLSFIPAHDVGDDNLSDEESADEADPPPEGGVLCILGKISQMGKIDYLLRWVDKPGLQWESAEVLGELCPNLIKLYEKKRAKQRERDMHYVMRRKKVRQDFRNV